MKKSNYLNKIVALVMFVLLVLSVTVFRSNFTSDYNSLVGFKPANFSNTITADKPARIDFTVSENDMSMAYLCFAPDSEASLKTALNFTLTDSDGTLLKKFTASGMHLYTGQYINITPEQPLAAGTKCSLLIESDVTDGDAAYHILLGSSLSNDVDAWYCGDTLETGNLEPGLHIVYKNHFGTKTFVIYILLFIMCIFALLLPKTKYFDKVKHLFSFGIMAGSGPVLLYCVEMLAFGSILNLSPKLIICNLLIIWGLQLTVAAVTGRVYIGTLSGVLLSVVAGVTSYFVMLYRGTAISPVDLYALTSAANIVSNYSFDISIAMMLSLIMFATIAVFALRYKATLPLKKIYGVFTRVLCLALGTVMLLFTCSTKSLVWTEAVVYMKENTDSARRNGMMYNFVQCLPSLFVSEPEGYSLKKASVIADKYMPQDSENEYKKPDIVVVMMETWSDYSQFTDLSYLSEDPMEYLHKVASDSNPNTHVGNTVVPVYGSGTCNSEFESITGFSMANFDGTAFPYLQYVVDGTPSLASYLGQLGYTTTALHPGIESTWNRLSVYKWLGFDKMKFDVDFENQHMIHQLISDKSCFNEILLELPTDTSADPAFVFNVTISNHGGYNKNDDFELSVTADSDDPMFDEMERYSSLLYYTSQELEVFLNEIDKRERDTIVIFFGDHLPQLNTEYLNYIHFDNILAQNPATQFTTPYMVYANYHIDTTQLPETVSSNYISLMALKLAGLPLNGWYSFLDELMDVAPVYSICSIHDGKGGAVDNTEILTEYQWFQYGGLKDKKSYPDNFFS